MWVAEEDTYRTVKLLIGRFTCSYLELVVQAVCWNCTSCVMLKFVDAVGVRHNCIDSVDNFSDHLLVFFTLNCSTLSTHLRSIQKGWTNSASGLLSTKINRSKITEDDKQFLASPSAQPPLAFRPSSLLH